MDYYGKKMEPERLFWSCPVERKEQIIKEYSSSPYFCRAWAGWKRALHHHMYLVCLFEIEDGDHPLLKYCPAQPNRFKYKISDVV